MKTLSEIKKIIEYGTKAPSGHNTQPWKFILKENEIQIHPDFNRALPIVDADNHALYISLGCAAENVIIASKQEGFSPALSILKNDEGIHYISITLSLDKSVIKDALFGVIEKRQVTRSKYSQKKVSDIELNQLLESSHFEGVALKLFTTKTDIKKLEPFIIEGSNLQFQNKKFVEELVSWIRFSKKEVEQKRDGIWHASMSLPTTGRFLGNIIMKKFVSAKSEAKRWKSLIDTSAGFVLFITKENDVAHWVNLGRSFQRFGLKATQLNISHSHVNMPCEELSVRKRMIEHLSLGTKHPLLLIRFGYSDKLPYSYRRLSKDVIFY